MWTNEQPLTLHEVHILNMVCAKGLRPADDPPDQALVIHAKQMYIAAGRNYPWEELSQHIKCEWVKAYQRQLRKAWGPFEILP